MEEKKDKVVPATTPTSQVPAAKVPLTPQQLFKRELTAFEKPILSLLASYGYSHDDFIVTVDNMVRMTPKLLNCDRKTLFASILVAAELGLKPNTKDQFCSIIPYSNHGVLEAQFQLGYFGCIEIILRNPEVKRVDAEVWFQNDDFSYQLHPDKKVNHHNRASSNRGDLCGAYAFIEYKDGTKQYEFATKEELDQIQKISKSGSGSNSAYNNGTDVFHWMQKKVPIKQLFKTARKISNKSQNILKALDYANLSEMGATITLDADQTVKIIMPERNSDTSNKSKANAIYGDISDAITENENVVAQIMAGNENENPPQVDDSVKPEPPKTETKKVEPPVDAKKTDVTQDNSLFGETPKK